MCLFFCLLTHSSSASVATRCVTHTLLDVFVLCSSPFVIDGGAFFSYHHTFLHGRPPTFGGKGVRKRHISKRWGERTHVALTSLLYFLALVRYVLYGIYTLYYTRTNSARVCVCVGKESVQNKKKRQRLKTDTKKCNKKGTHVRIFTIYYYSDFFFYFHIRIESVFTHVPIRIKLTWYLKKERERGLFVINKF